MSLWLERFYELDHYLALRREADQHRIFLHCLVRRKNQTLARSQALFWFGTCFIRLGTYLQKRFGSAVSEDGAKPREA